MPNYTLHEPTNPDLNIVGSNSTTVNRPTKLSELLTENQGECHWAACTYNEKALNSNKLWDLDGVIDI